MEVRNHGRHASKVVGVRMSDHDRVKMIETTVP